MNRIDAHGLKFHDEASGRFHSVVGVSDVQGGKQSG